MGVGAGYRERNPYRHSDASYQNALDSGREAEERLGKEIKQLEQRIEVILAANPDPLNYEIIDVYESETRFALKIRYPNCKNREGLKILVFNGKFIDLIKQRTIDPHFGDDAKMYPFARFEPTDGGWELAKLLVTH